MEELQVVRSERDIAVAEQKTLQQTITSLEQDKQVYETGHLMWVVYLLFVGYVYRVLMASW